MANQQQIHQVHLANQVLPAEYFCQELWNLPGNHEWPLYPYCFEEVRRGTPIRFREISCPYMIAVWLVDGAIDYECGEESFLLRPGELLILPRGASYSFCTVQEPAFYHKLVLEFKGANLSAITETVGLNRVVRVAADNGLEERFRKLGAAMRDRSESTIPALLGLCYELLGAIAQKARPGDSDSRLLIKAQSRLESKFNEKISVPELARELGVTYSELNRLFREHLNTTPKRYRIIRRIEQAQYLLGNTSLSVKEIAFRLGYCSQFYFANEFRELTGSSPRAYRQAVMR